MATSVEVRATIWPPLSLSHWLSQAMWLMLQQENPEDFVVATGEAHSVRELVELAFQQIQMEIRCLGEMYKHAF